MNTYEIRNACDTGSNPKNGSWNEVYENTHEFDAEDTDAAIEYAETLQAKHDEEWKRSHPESTDAEMASAPCYAACLYRVIQEAWDEYAYIQI